MSQSVAQTIVDTLEKAGVKRWYGVPGDTLNYITDAIRTNKNMRWIHVRHEEVGGFAAGADSMLTGELTVCAGSCGPGSLHFINGLMESHRNRAPVVLIASQIVRDELGFDFPQEVDFKSIYESCSVFCEEIRTPEQAQRLTVMAAQAALAKRGVAVLIVPADVSMATAPKTSYHYAVHHANPRVTPSESELHRIADLLNAGSKVAIYGGSGCEQAHDQVVALAEKLRAPVVHTSRATDFLAHDNPYDVGMAGMLGYYAGVNTLAQCDTLILLGCDFAWRQFYPQNAKIIQVDIDNTHIGRRHPVDVGVVGNIADTLEALLPLVKAKQDDAFLQASLALYVKDKAKENKHNLDQPGHPIHPQYLVETIAKYADEDAVYTADGGTAMLWCLRHVPSTGKNRRVISLTHGTMAGAMPQALGAKAAFPHRQVISLSGDGGLAMLMGDLLTAIQERLAIKVCIINNSALGFVDLEQKVEGLISAFTDLHNPDFSKVAEAIGFWSRRVEKSADVDQAVRDWINEPGPALLDVVTDRFELIMPPKVGVEQVFGTALYSTKAILAGEGKDVIGMVRNLLT
jgi:pyruvate dehydrogenase (quinone)